MLDNESLRSLCNSDCVATFLKNWISKNFPKSSYESLSRRCKISSKSTIHDILSGRRNPSLNLLTKVCAGLKIRGPEKKLLLKIWECSKENSFSIKSKELSILRSKVLQKNSKIQSDKIPLLEDWDYVYASLGTIENGASIEDISRRSRISKERCLKILANLIELQLVSFHQDTEKYLPNGLHSIFEESSLREKEYLRSKLKITQQKLNQNFGTPDESLYRHYFFSIKKGVYPKLRSRLKELLDEFADESESPIGEDIAEIFLAFNLKT